MQHTLHCKQGTFLSAYAAMGAGVIKVMRAYACMRGGVKVVRAYGLGHQLSLDFVKFCLSICSENKWQNFYDDMH